MEQYRILCSPKQTKKAIELGAPIEHARVIDTINGHSIQIPEETGDFYLVPTAEQMIGWLEEKGIMLNIATNPFDEFKIIVSKAGGYFDNIADIEWNESRKEATLAAIDAALEYLSNNKN